MEEIIIRWTRPEDYEAFETLYAQCIYLDGTGTCAHTERYGKDKFEEMCEGNIIVAEKAGMLVGYIIIYASSKYDDVLEISEMFTTISVRGCGVGRKMLAFMESEMNGTDYNKIDLMSFSMRTDRIWERMGFRSINFSEHYRKTL